jgi:thioesterase domain-containing protein
MSDQQTDIANRLQTTLYEDIPLVRALALEVRLATPLQVVFFAPLAPNINDKGCAFGGSLASLLTLACWSLLRVHTWQQNLIADIYVHTSKLLYTAPIWGDFEVIATLTSEALAEFDANFAAKGKAAALPHADAMTVDAQGGALSALRMDARFVAIRSPAPSE